jgi:hypothetical protein
MKPWLRRTALVIGVTFLALAPALTDGEPLGGERPQAQAGVGAPEGPSTTITVRADHVRAVASSFAAWHAAALRSGCDALASGQVHQAMGTIAQSLQWVTGSTGKVGESLGQLRTLLEQSRDTTRPDPASCANLEASLRRTISRAEALSR